jgi:uncharacterized protein YuzE
MDEELTKVEINWDTLENILKYEAIYDKKSDTLLIQAHNSRPAVSVDCDGKYWVRVDPQTGEILGIEIEQFRRVFLKKHADLFKRQTAYVRPITDFVRLEKCPT